MSARITTRLRVDHAQLANIRMRLTEAILRNGGGIVTVADAIERAKKMADRLLGPHDPQGTA